MIYSNEKKFTAINLQKFIAKHKPKILELIEHQLTEMGFDWHKTDNLKLKRWYYNGTPLKLK